jgi:rhodanese-related sulfurtransferase
MKKGLMLIVAIIAIVAFVSYLVYFHTQLLSYNIPNLVIPINQARAKRFNLILDVRTEKEREELGYYPNSIPLSMHKLNKIKSLTTNMNTSILVYSNGDQVAEQAAKQIYTMGYHNVRYITTSYLYLLPGQ